jgi:hypothetical protein
LANVQAKDPSSKSAQASFREAVRAGVQKDTPVVSFDDGSGSGSEGGDEGVDDDDEIAELENAGQPTKSAERVKNTSVKTASDSDSGSEEAESESESEPTTTKGSVVHFNKGSVNAPPKALADSKAKSNSSESPDEVSGDNQTGSEEESDEEEDGSMGDDDDGDEAGEEQSGGDEVSIEKTSIQETKSSSKSASRSPAREVISSEEVSSEDESHSDSYSEAGSAPESEEEDNTLQALAASGSNASVNKMPRQSSAEDSNSSDAASGSEVEESTPRSKVGVRQTSSFGNTSHEDAAESQLQRENRESQDLRSSQPTIPRKAASNGIATPRASQSRPPNPKHPNVNSLSNLMDKSSQKRPGYKTPLEHPERSAETLSAVLADGDDSSSDNSGSSDDDELGKESNRVTSSSQGKVQRGWKGLVKGKYRFVPVASCID